MEVHLCTFEITLQSARVAAQLNREQLEALWRTERAELIIIGAIRPTPKKNIAVFNENFQIKTDLLRDPQTSLYHSNIIILEIRKASQSLNQTMMPSIIRFNLADILNGGSFL